MRKVLLGFGKLESIEACKRVLLSGREITLLLAYAIEGGPEGTHWAKLPEERKQHLKIEFRQMKRDLRK